MTTWPTANKATTTDIDQGTDSPNLSRVQIKKDLDNINSITDTFDIPTSTPNGSILAYDDTAGEFNTTSAQSLSKAFLIYKGFEEDLINTQSEEGIYPTTADGRRNNMLDRRLKYDPFGLITDITGDGFQLSEGTYLINTQSQQTYYITNYGAFGSVQGPSWLGHRIQNIEDDGDSTDNYPARWDNYSSSSNDTTARAASHAYKFTVPAGGTRKYYLFYDRGGTNTLAYDFGASTTIGSTNNQRANVVIEIIKIGG
jgi:hypothetical protein